MAKQHKVTVNGATFLAAEGERLLDAALRSGCDLPYDCRAGHCGTCCVRLVSGDVSGGEGVEPGIVHACQCRISGEVVVESGRPAPVRSVEGVVTSLLPLSHEVVEVGVMTSATVPHHAGQYAQVRFRGHPSRSFSITHPLRASQSSRALFFHMRRMSGGRVTPELGNRIKLGHRVSLTGPYGSAYFRPNACGRTILVATNTGFAPIWAIAVAALRENPERRMMIIAGGRRIESLYMGSALAQLARFPNVLVAPVCSTPQTIANMIMLGRPTDYLPRLLPTDILYACGAPGMVDAVKTIAERTGTVCHADPFVTSADTNMGETPSRSMSRWLPTGDTARKILMPRSRDGLPLLPATERGG